MKRIFTILMAALFATAMIACGDRDNTKTNTENTSENGGGNNTNTTTGVAGSWRGLSGGNEYTLDLGTQGMCVLYIVYNIDTDDERSENSDYSPYTYSNGSGSFDLVSDPDAGYRLSGHGTFTVSGSTLTLTYGGATVAMTHAQ